MELFRILLFLHNSFFINCFLLISPTILFPIQTNISNQPIIASIPFPPIADALSSAKDNLLGAVTGQRRRSSHQQSSISPQMRPLLPKSSNISQRSQIPMGNLGMMGGPPPPGLSPIASVSSSTSCIPKSSSSTGPLHSPIDYEIQHHPDKGNIHSLADIDDRLEAINE